MSSHVNLSPLASADLDQPGAVLRVPIWRLFLPRTDGAGASRLSGTGLLRVEVLSRGADAVDLRLGDGRGVFAVTQELLTASDCFRETPEAAPEAAVAPTATEAPVAAQAQKIEDRFQLRSEAVGDTASLLHYLLERFTSEFEVPPAGTLGIDAFYYLKAFVDYGERQIAENVAGLTEHMYGSAVRLADGTPLLLSSYNLVNPLTDLLPAPAESPSFMGNAGDRGEVRSRAPQPGTRQPRQAESPSYPVTGNPGPAVRRR